MIRSSMAGDLILVTGGTEFIGFHILLCALRAGYTVRAAVPDSAAFDRIYSLDVIEHYRSRLTSFIVPNNTAPGAYDAAVRGVKFVIHSSPLPAQNAVAADDYEGSVIRPAIQETLNVLEAVHRASGIKRVVITESIASIANIFKPTETPINESTRTAITSGPYPDMLTAYSSAKAQTHRATWDFITNRTPSFDVVNILPVFVIGRDDGITAAEEHNRGSNILLVKPLLGEGYPTIPVPTPGVTVDIHDVAKMHVKALNPDVPGNEDYIASADPNGGYTWEDLVDIIKTRYPEQYNRGMFKIDDAPRRTTQPCYIDSSKAEDAFGMAFRTFEEGVVEAIDQYLELLGIH
ncbi:Ketoreductase CTB6 [Cladobotryum mycophilum]|uniref:Ketoreductase CTB6 n=1 Tax=Cladobotryum mycophilum TaxID=491253 RepID=A0ABR0SP02_9HYPO